MRSNGYQYSVVFSQQSKRDFHLDLTQKTRYSWGFHFVHSEYTIDWRNKLIPSDRAKLIVLRCPGNYAGLLWIYSFPCTEVQKAPCESLEERKKMLWAGDICFEKVNPLVLTLSKIFFNPIDCQNWKFHHDTFPVWFSVFVFQQHMSYHWLKL